MLSKPDSDTYWLHYHTINLSPASEQLLGSVLISVMRESHLEGISNATYITCLLTPHSSISIVSQS
jgi:hypothetical protein